MARLNYMYGILHIYDQAGSSELITCKINVSWFSPITRDSTVWVYEVLIYSCTACNKSNIQFATLCNIQNSIHVCNHFSLFHCSIHHTCMRFWKRADEPNFTTTRWYSNIPMLCIEGAYFTSLPPITVQMSATAGADFHGQSTQNAQWQSCFWF